MTGMRNHPSHGGRGPRVLTPPGFSRHSVPPGGGLVDAVLGMLALVLVAAGFLGVRDVMVNPDSPARAGSGILHLLTPPPSLSAISLGGERQMTLLLVGADDRRGARGRADTVIVAYIAPASGRVALLSIPRDLRTQIPGRRRDKINHAYAFGGVKLLHRTVEGVLGERMDRHAKVDFQTFERVIDLLGGVEVDVPDVEGRGRGMNYQDRADGLLIRLKPGRQRLNGDQAMGFVRYRRDSDVKRTERQRQLLKAVAAQHMRPARLPALIRAATEVRREMETDLSSAEITRLASGLRGIPQENIFSAVLPTRSAPSRGVYYREVVDSEAAALRAQIREFLEEAGRVDKTLKEFGVAVLNGSGVAGAAQGAADLMRGHVARITAVGNAEGFDHRVTEIRCHPEAAEAAEEARQLLGIPRARVQVDTELSAPGGAAILVTVGRDFARSQG